MATQTTNYGLTKPAWDDMVDVSVLNNNSDIIDAQMYANELSAKQAVANMADAYDATATYAEGDYCTYGGKLYQANTDISVAEAFDATHWDETTAAEHFSDGGGGGGGVHYSTTEQVIGTWIDGSTLYQRTFTGLSTPTQGTGWAEITDIDASAWENVIDATVYRVSGAGTLVKMPLAEIGISNNNHPQISVVSSDFNGTVSIAIFTYTKTTD